MVMKKERPAKKKDMSTRGFRETIDLDPGSVAREGEGGSGRVTVDLDPGSVAREGEIKRRRPRRRSRT